MDNKEVAASPAVTSNSKPEKSSTSLPSDSELPSRAADVRPAFASYLGFDLG
ncbi:hypothetical protein PGT21_011927 [Puccinia graminis f. sp. tritici]|uniref:Uncharacterized protein n=1 Tax=Puccinia graminis f. sp. tritici TaxID=56615 RepID=A0A5B0N2N5_PUCGR|nr:hypothetical protein PGT21_011927 [Puccinia graminis f. sp. tritici]KAA1088073.1 hypothetical protein PGTUg99_026975 [Puccinia graminis f. sp. tritici]